MTLSSDRNPNFVYAYNRKTFNKFNSIKKHKETCKKYIKLHPNIEKYIDHIKSTVFTQEGDNVKYVGIHIGALIKLQKRNLQKNILYIIIIIKYMKF